MSAIPNQSPPRDHVALGRELGIFTTDPLVGPGLPLWLPDGAAIRHELERFVLDIERRAGFQHVITPSVAKQQLYEQSGHWEFYAEDMFPAMALGAASDGELVVLRPVNCPHHVLVYRHAERSYRELPLRLAELGDMYRMERSGVVSGLSRVRAMTLNDGHIFCRSDQVGQEVRATLDLVLECMAALDLEIAEVRLSTRDDRAAKWAGSRAQWERGEAALREVLEASGIPWSESPGDAAFYGPKVDVDVLDVHGRAFTLSTVQVDLWMPERFDLRYVAGDGSRPRPVMVHRSLLSTAERLMAFLLERTQGRFPYWLAPQQVWVLPVSAAQDRAAGDVVASLVQAGVRCRVVPAEKSLGARIRLAEARGVPLTVILGEREVASASLSLRLRGGDDVTGLALPDVRQALVDAAAQRRARPDFAAGGMLTGLAPRC